MLKDSLIAYLCIGFYKFYDFWAFYLGDTLCECKHITLWYYVVDSLLADLAAY